MVKRSPTLGTLVSIKTKCIKLIFIGKITLVPVAFLMALSIHTKFSRKIKPPLKICFVQFVSVMVDHHKNVLWMAIRPQTGKFVSSLLQTFIFKLTQFEICNKERETKSGCGSLSTTTPELYSGK